MAEHPLDEHLNAWTHGVGAALASGGALWLVGCAATDGDPWRITSMSVYGASLVLLLLASTLYHAARSPRAKRVLQAVDHAAIFLLIAGTYTPFVLVPLRGPWGWSLFGVVWGLAAVGVPLKLWLGREAAHARGLMDKLSPLSTALYLAMGWVGVVAAVPMWGALPVAALGWLIAGGLAYSAGVWFFVREDLRFNHAWWHLFVLAGAACHFVAIGRYVLPLD